MEKQTKILLTLASIFVGLGLLLIWQIQSLGKLRLIACDVGEGDGLLVISPGGNQVLVDGGPGSKILDCLSQKMPFWDRTIEMVVLTHPQKDHLEGLISVLAKYQVKMVATTGIGNETAVFGHWQKALQNEQARVYIANSGDRLILDKNASFAVLWPNHSQIAEWQQKPPAELNQTSVVLRLEFSQPSGRFCAYLTGDLPKKILETLIDTSCQILKVSHHGSKTGTSEQLLDRAKPVVAIIQVGRNSYGHPHQEVIDLLTSKGVKVLRNDTNGIIEIESDGKSYKIKNEK